MADETSAEDRVLEMRSSGRSYGAIAETLGFTSARVAVDTFQVALRRWPAAERAELRDQELRRLDEFANQLRGEPGLSETELE